MATRVEQAMEHIITAYNEGRYAGKWAEPNGVPKRIPLEFSVSHGTGSKLLGTAAQDTLLVEISQGRYPVDYRGSSERDVLRRECLPQDGINIHTTTGWAIEKETWHLDLGNGTEEKIIKLAERLGFERVAEAESGTAMSFEDARDKMQELIAANAQHVHGGESVIDASFEFQPATSKNDAARLVVHLDETRVVQKAEASSLYTALYESDIKPMVSHVSNAHRFEEAHGRDRRPPTPENEDKRNWSIELEGVRLNRTTWQTEHFDNELAAKLDNALNLVSTTTALANASPGSEVNAADVEARGAETKRSRE